METVSGIFLGVFITLIVFVMTIWFIHANVSKKNGRSKHDHYR